MNASLTRLHPHAHLSAPVPHRATLAPLVAGAVLACLASGVQAQSLIELYEAARGYDAAFLAARSQLEANQAKADQARAGLLPTVGLSSRATWTNTDSSAAAASPRAFS